MTIRFSRQPRVAASGPPLYMSFPVASLADLAALVSPPPDDADLVFVETLQAWFYFDSDSSIAADGITIIAPSAGTGRWLRILDPATHWQVQSEWWIDSGAGSDENTGATPSSALATWAEFRRRVGPGNWSENVTVNIVAAVDQALNGEFVILDDARLTIQGVPVTERTSALTGVTPIDEATNQALEIEDTSVDWTGDVNKRIRLTSGTPENSVAWIGTELSPTNLARVSPFQTLSSFGPASFPFAIAGDETYVIETLPAVRAVTLKVQRGAIGGPTQFIGLLIQNLEITEPNGMVVDANESFIPVCWGCRLNQGTVVGGMTFTGCNMGISGSFGANVAPTFNACLFSISCSFDGFARVNQNCLFQGRRLQANGVVFIEADGLGLFDAPTDAILVGAAGRVVVLAGVLIWGASNATAVSVRGGGRLIYRGTKPVIAGTTEVDLGDGDQTIAWAAAPQINAARDCAVLDQLADATIV